jgi:hypothetical protein
MAAPDSPLSPALRDRVLERLGFARAPGVDLAGLRALYQAWCLHVPFDNIRKMTALRAAGVSPLPGATAQDFFDAWLSGGAGGACWPGSNALYTLLRSTGFASDPVAASMRDTGAATHGSVRVDLDGGHWLVDSSLLTNIPLPLGPDASSGATRFTQRKWSRMPGLTCCGWTCPPAAATSAAGSSSTASAGSISTAATKSRAAKARSTGRCTPAGTCRRSC